MKDKMFNELMESVKEMDQILQGQKYNDKREVLIRALESGEKSGVSKHTLDEIWKDVKTRRR